MLTKSQSCPRSNVCFTRSEVIPFIHMYKLVHLTNIISNSLTRQIMPGSTPTSDSSSSKSPKTGIIIGSVIGSCGFIVLVGLGVFLGRRSKKSGESNSITPYAMTDKNITTPRGLLSSESISSTWVTKSRFTSGPNASNPASEPGSSSDAGLRGEVENLRREMAEMRQMGVFEPPPEYD